MESSVNAVASLQNLLGNMDIYLLDQILKGRYLTGSKILDAGAGTGRNIHWFAQNNYDVSVCDINEDALKDLQLMLPAIQRKHVVISSIEDLPFPKQSFDHVICSAVLHFAKNEPHFKAMLRQLMRVLKPGGTLFIRMASNFGIDQAITNLGDGRYLLPDGSERFLLNEKLLQEIKSYGLQLLEPLKTTLVHNQRSMTTLVLQKI